MESSLLEPDVRTAAYPASPLDAALARAFRLLGAVEDFALQLSNPEDLDSLPAIGVEIEQANLRGFASLYLASELESAGLLPAAELLAGLFRSGALPVDLGPGAEMLHRFWAERRDRFTPQERRGFFAYAFGRAEGPGFAEGGPNERFEGLLAAVCRVLHGMREPPLFDQPIGPQHHVRLSTAALALAVNLAARSGGMTPYAAREILETVRLATDILKQPAVLRAVRARSVWEAVKNIYRRYLHQEPDTTNHLTRGRSGMIVLQWLADVAPRLSDWNARLISPGHTAISAATAWLQASSTLVSSA